ncbi:MAG: EcsC family protein [SAR324 cluster bacterium]|nr:EcsC family protein [SAR324 cluster bacterium]
MLFDHKLTPEQLEQIKKSLKLLSQTLDKGIDGFGPLQSAESLGEKFLANPAYETKMEKIQALARWEIRKNFSTGFLTSLGGILTLPLAIPASLAASWILQIRMVAAMAHIAGFNITDPPVKTSIAICLLGNKAKDLLDADLSQIEAMLRKQGNTAGFSKQSLQVINQALASALIRMATEKGFTRVGKAIPLLGGVAGGLLDYLSAKESANFAIELFDMERTLT